jgi:lipopolysaccharide assembly protein A
MRVFCFLILLIVVAAVVVFAVQNNDDVTIHYLDRSISSPMSLLIGVVYVLGMVSGWTVVGFLRRSFRRMTERPKD